MMAKESAGVPERAGSLDALGVAASRAALGRRPPVHLWDPPFCGDIDIRIAADGTWFHAGTPIGRPALVRLFASILRREADGVMLVTPVEKLRLMVEDAPFVAVELALGEEPVPRLCFRTNVDEWVTADAEHPLVFRPGAAGGLKPYLQVRPGLEARVSRALFYDLVDRGELREHGGQSTFGVASGPLFFTMAPAAAGDRRL